ncbi:hypothetical protein [Thalassobellus sediminis]|uniref:hypothetical protein n=1 Tax=Thalassobellus sediminis TaxID=3367753 RepID=UPI0037B8375D
MKKTLFILLFGIIGFAQNLVILPITKQSVKEIDLTSTKETIIVAEGQSNMVGTDAEIVPYDVTVNNNVLIWNKGTSKWDVLDSRADKIYWSFAKKYQETYGGTVKIILNASGGMPIDDWIQEGSTDRHQGENNGSDVDYFYKLQKRIDLLESLNQYDTNEYFFLFGGLIKGVGSYSLWHATSICFENVMTSKNVAYVDSKGLISVRSGTGVNIHFDGADLHKFGQRYFKVYQNMSIGQNLQKQKHDVITTNNSDLWDFTADTFILTDAEGWSSIVIPKPALNKEYTIVNLRSTSSVTLTPSEGKINRMSTYILPPNTSVKIKGIRNEGGSIIENQILSITPKNFVVVVGSNITLSNAYYNSTIRLTGNSTITIPTGLYPDFKMRVDVVSGTLSLLGAKGVTLQKLNGFNTAVEEDWIEIYRAFPTIETYRAKKL